MHSQQNLKKIVANVVCLQKSSWWMPTFRWSSFPLRGGVSRVWVRSDLYLIWWLRTSEGERRGNGHVFVQNADDNGRAGLGVYYTARTSLEAWIYTWGFFCVCVVRGLPTGHSPSSEFYQIYRNKIQNFGNGRPLSTMTCSAIRW